MKKSHFPATLKTRAIALFCALFAFFTSVSAQNDATKKLQGIKEFRAYCIQLLNALPSTSTVQTSSAFSTTEKQKLISVIKTVDEASQIKDNVSDATFSRLKKKIEGVGNWLDTFEPASAKSAAKANDSPNSDNSPLEKCFNECSATFTNDMNKCRKNRTLTTEQRAVCQANALGSHVGCMLDCPNRI